jgi:hypothetical protein
VKTTLWPALTAAAPSAWTREVLPTQLGTLKGQQVAVCDQVVLCRSDRLMGSQRQWQSSNDLVAKAMV